MGIKPGQEVHIMVYGGRIELIPLKPVEELRGMLKGIDTAIERDPDRV
jgi:bifunctional DNA-binding transcriptional regulator/antitoxin component of YhaV-PrlF toxin-antitoxin module